MVKVRILLTGAAGLVGREVAFAAIRRGHTVYAGWHDREPDAGHPIRLDISDTVSVRKAFEQKLDVVIHLAALTDVDKCETDESMATEINALATERMAREAEANRAHFVYVSTDYIFDGGKGLYSEGDKPNPINKYGWSKLRGEQAVMAASSGWCIARISTPFGVHPFRKSFATFLAEKLASGDKVNVVSDQFTSPTFTGDLSETLVEIAERRVGGILHVSGSVRCSRLDFAHALADRLSLDRSLVNPVLMSEIPWKARRPRDSSLSVEKASGILKCKPSGLTDSLSRYAQLYLHAQTNSESFNRRGV